VQRLLLGVDAALLGSTLVCVLNQRLLRKLCEHCEQAITPNASILAKLKIDPSQQGTWFQPVGCERCSGTGYHG
jgi:type II secretory ATPase GspE/PulE/Tfp pilus assembly ATPase PilB-like protein